MADQAGFTMRILALDHGTKRVGVAISDETLSIAQPVEYIPAEPPGGLLERIRQLIHEREVGLVIVGMPRNMDGSYGPAAAAVQEFVQSLRNALSVPVKTWDERLTTVQANRYLREANVRHKKSRERVDKIAAAILLQSYLDAREPGAGF